MLQDLYFYGLHTYFNWLDCPFKKSMSLCLWANVQDCLDIVVHWVKPLLGTVASHLTVPIESLFCFQSSFLLTLLRRQWKMAQVHGTLLPQRACLAPNFGLLQTRLCRHLRCKPADRRFSICLSVSLSLCFFLPLTLSHSVFVALYFKYISKSLNVQSITE